jgi:hypothetical protein
MLSVAKYILVGVIVVAGAGQSLGKAVPPLTPEQQAEVAEWIKQLGHRSFAVREAAGERLAKMGRGVEPMLREALADPDPEIRERCRRLIPRAINFELDRQLGAFLRTGEATTPLGGWPRYREIVGDTPESRSFFIDLYRVEPELLDGLERSRSKYMGRLATRTEQYAQTYMRGKATAPIAETAMLLLALGDPKNRLEDRAGFMFQFALQWQSNQENTRLPFRDNLSLRKLLLAFVERDTDPSMSMSMSLISNLELPEGLTLARKVIRSDKAIPHARAVAISLIGKLGTRRDIADLEPLLKNDTVVGMASINNVRVTTQLRDVALATVVRLSGQDAADYGYPYLKMFRGNPNFSVSPALLGFPDTASRNDAFKKWQVWKSSNPG